MRGTDVVRVLRGAAAVSLLVGAYCTAGPARSSDGPVLRVTTVPGQEAGEVVVELGLAGHGALANGCGLALAFDSSELKFEHCTEVLQDGFLGDEEATGDDDDDLDHDPKTDRLVRLAWLAPSGTWSGGSGEVLLARVTFRHVQPTGRENATSVAVVPLAETGLRTVYQEVRSSLTRVSPKTTQAIPRTHDEATQRERVEAVRELDARAWSSAVQAASTCSLDADGNGQFDALTDGILVMRHLFGFSGTALTDGAVGAGATRSTPADVDAFLGDAACTDMLDADGNSERDALTDGILIARYLFGFTGQSLVSGALGPGATRTDGATVAGYLEVFKSTGPILVLRAPSVGAPLLSEIEAELLVGTTYTGGGSLVYSLVQGPSGMTLDAAAGRITWTPPRSQEGQQATVKVAATDGTLTADVTFSLQVAAGTQVATSVNGVTVTVTQAGSLQGLALTLPAQATVPPSQVKVYTVAAAQAPPLPAGLTRISDFFRVSPVAAAGGLITVAMPTGALPSGVSAEQVRLYVHSGADVSATADGPTDMPEWLSSSYGLDVRPGGVVAVQVDRLGSLSFIGYDGSASATTAAAVSASPFEQAAAGAACTPKTYSSGLVSQTEVVCRGDATAQSLQRAITVTVRGFATNQWSPATTEAELAGWVQTVNAHFTGLGLASDPQLEVVVENLPVASWLGFVTTGNGEDRRVLHLARSGFATDKMKSTTAHEYFHHAQSRTTVAGKSNAINVGAAAQWLYEGTARWYEDEVYDSISSYQSLNRKPHPLILTYGVASPPKWVDNDPQKARITGTSPYDRFAWWKMVGLFCSGLSLPEVLNFDATSDPTGLGHLATLMTSTPWQCDFGAGFGDENKATLAAALLYYTYATVKEDDISRLDANEPYFKCAKSPWMLTPSVECTGNWSSCPASAKITGLSVFQGAALPFRLAAVEELTPGTATFVRVVNTSNDGPLWVWLGDNEKPGGLTSGQWVKVEPDDDKTVLYATGSRAPETMMIVVNPHPDRAVGYELYAGVASSYAVYPDLEHSILPPIFYPGSPDVDFTLVLRSQLTLPAQYKVVWSFDDGTADVTVNNDPTIEHRWAQVGNHPVTAKLYELPSSTLAGQATGVARIDYFYGRFQLSTFAGGASGEFGDPMAASYVQFLANVSAGPSNAQLSVSHWTSGDRDVLLYFDPPGGESQSYWLVLDSVDRDNGTSDCPESFVINGDHITARWANPQYNFTSGSLAGMCMSLDMTQTGSHVDGTYSMWAKYYQADNQNNPILINQGQASYTFTSTYVKK